MPLANLMSPEKGTVPLRIEGQSPFPDMRRPESRAKLEMADRRLLPRYCCNRRPIVRFLVRPSFEPQRAFLQEISRRGMRLVFKHPLEPGTVLAVQLRSNQAGLSLILTAKITHATQENDSGWLLGCSLSRPLTDDEIFALL